jgi:hypothetical protein
MKTKLLSLIATAFLIFILQSCGNTDKTKLKEPGIDSTITVDTASVVK